jgi:alpha-mannosidase
LNLHRRSEELQTPAEYVMDSAHPGGQPWERSFLAVTPDNIAVLAVKRAEDGEALIIRLQEMQGRQTTARVVFPPFNLDRSVAVGPWEIRTIAVSEAEGRTIVREVDLLERATGE